MIAVSPLESLVWVTVLSFVVLRLVPLVSRVEYGAFAMWSGEAAGELATEAYV